MSKLKYEWRQTDSHVLVSLLVKNFQPKDIDIEFEARACMVTISLGSGSDSIFILDPLSQEIEPKRCSYEVKPSHVEITLAKVAPVQRWPELDEGGQCEVVTTVAQPSQPSTISIDEEQSVPIQIMSDLHLEFYFHKSGGGGPGYYIFDLEPTAPYLALLGDIGLAPHDGLFAFLESQLTKYEKIFFVMGNHEGYQSTYEEARARIRAFAEKTGGMRTSDPSLAEFIFLDRTRYDLTDRTTILGCTLWSFVPPEDTDAVRRGMSDFRQVRDWTIEAYKEAHLKDVAWLNEQCRKIGDEESGRQIVIFTHHAPTLQTISSAHAKHSKVDSAYATEMTVHPCWDPPVKTWAFGHTHHNCDFALNGVRGVSNSRGYEGDKASGIRFFMGMVVHV